MAPYILSISKGNIMPTENSLSYKDAGVDIDTGNKFVQCIKPIAKKTSRPEVMGSLGGFGALFKFDTQRYTNPILVSATDGVGTKLKLAMQLGDHSTIGIDLVAMCVNDLIVCGAEPLFFLDYFATGKLDLDQAQAVVSGIGKGCELAGCALVGGETAEMPGLYQGSEYDLAGFCVGVVEQDNMITGEKISAGDQLIGIASSGPHSNGYSLIRKIIETSQADLSSSFANSTLGESLLTPTKIYVKTILELTKQQAIHGIAHITGGGIQENLIRILPDNTQAIIDTNSWQIPEVFQWLQQAGNVQDADMQLTFNLGLGMILCVPEAGLNATLELLNSLGETAFHIGRIEQNSSAATEVKVI